MLKNYLKIALRNILRDKVFSIINIAGLAIGIATCLIIMLFVQDELSYDKFNEKADRIVRVGFKGKMSGETMNEASVMPPVAKALQNDYPAIQNTTRLKIYGGIEKIVYQTKTFRENKVAFVDPNFFEVFTIPFIKGNTKKALNEPNTVVISKEAANKYFGNQDPIGKLLNFKNTNTFFKVTGLFDKIPENAHFHFDLFASMANIPEAKETSWMAGNFYTYLVLPEGYDYKKLEAKLPLAVEKYLGPELKVSMGMDLSQFRQKGNDVGLYLQPLTDIHLKSNSTSELEANSNIQYVYILGAIALFMLLIACINFVNLSTASSAKRAKEVGIRKVLGSERKELIGQFMVESILLTVLALVVSVALVYAVLPMFNQLSGKNLYLGIIDNPLIILALIAFGLFIGLLAGFYPAFFLSSFQPIKTLKSKLTTKTNGIDLRSGLVVFQFSVSVILIIGTFVVYKQLNYIQNKKLGYEKDQIIVMKNTWALGAKEAAYLEELRKNSNIINISNSGYLPAGNTYENLISTSPTGNKSVIRRTHVYQIDDQYIPTMGMKILKGRNFSKAFSTDSSAILINETLAKLYGWNNNAIGRTLEIFSDNVGSTKKLVVIGIVQDFHFNSLHKAIEPLMMVQQETSGFIIKAKAQNIQPLITKLKTDWTNFHVEEPFSYTFLDEDFNKIYISEQKIGKILGIFTGLTIFIACLGLFGLVTYIAEQRTKEIGIRKVLGATLPNLITLLSIDFLKLVIIAILIASPISYYLMQKWLQEFAYRINIEWWFFVIAGVVSIAIALLTIGYQAIKAAVANPIKSLKTE
jgi:putative ABC transport system permease protein